MELPGGARATLMNVLNSIKNIYSKTKAPPASIALEMSRLPLRPRPYTCVVELDELLELFELELELLDLELAAPVRIPGVMPRRDSASKPSGPAIKVAVKPELTWILSPSAPAV